MAEARRSAVADHRERFPVLARVPILDQQTEQMMRHREWRSVRGVGSVLLVVAAALAIVTTEARAQAVLVSRAAPVDDFSPSFLGMYRKAMEIEDTIRRHAATYGVDPDLALAVCLYESGGNAGLASHAGAQGYFQVMPATYRTLHVTTNIEAGVKYLGQLVRQFGREDRAIAAYNGGPGRVGRNGGIPLETLQYVIGVGHYRAVLKQHAELIRLHASRLHLTTVLAGDDWPTIAARTGIAGWELRLHNPFLAGRRLRAGAVIAFPPEPRQSLLTPTRAGAEYRTRIGDNYINLAITLGLEIESLRSANGLWQLQSVPAGTPLRIPLAIDRAGIVTAALTGREPATSLQPERELAAAEPDVDDSEPAVDEDPVQEASVKVVTPRAAAARPVAKAKSSSRSSATASRRSETVVHRVRRGETLTSIAERYDTTVSAIQRTNNLRRTTIQAGQRLRIARRQSPEA
jgi:LysM repeat protein